MPDPTPLDWETLYNTGTTPWEDGKPWAPLESLVRPLLPDGGRVLDAGCGFGTQSIALAGLGYQVLGVDIAATAVMGAFERAAMAGSSATFRVADVLTDDVGGPYDLVFDRGCFTNMPGAEGRRAYAERVHGLLAEDGHWLAVAGNADNRDPRTGGPDARGYPRQSLTELVSAVEPHFQVLSVQRHPFGAAATNDFTAWVLTLRKRSEE